MKLGRTLTTALILAVTSCGAAEEPSPTGNEPTVYEVVPDVFPGDAVQIDGVNAAIPQPGEGIVTTLLFDDGTGATLQLETLATGEVLRHLEVEQSEPDEGGLEIGAATPADCVPTAYSHLKHRWNKRLDWYVSHANRPSDMGAQTTVDGFRRGTQNIINSFNNCGMADQVSATASYKGTTTAKPQVNSDGSCGANDGKNVVGWGSLPTGTLAVTCTYYNPSTGIAVATDIKFNTKYKWYAGGSPPAGCSNRFSLRGVMTHERGHSYGLGHVSESKYPSLTMSTSTGPCTNAASSLGRGDVIGLRKLY